MMQIATEIKLNQVLCGKSEERLKEFPDNFFSGVITDPPYEINFMGKDWDASGIACSVELWKEVLRTAKPGSFLLCFGGTRTYHRVVCAIEDAGWIIKDQMMWLYGEGFPKSTNISKQIDKHGGEFIGWFGVWLRKWREENNVTQKEIAKLFPSKTNRLTGCVANWELGLNLPSCEQFNLICKTFNLPFENIEEAEREVTGRNKNVGSTGGFQNDGGYVGGKVTKSNNDITIPATNDAKRWDGYGTGLKPGWEPIIVAMKPLEQGLTYAQNAKKWGIAGLNIDGGRIAAGIDHIKNATRHTNKVFNGLNASPINTEASTKGRWPANVILSHSPDCVCVGTKQVGNGEYKKHTVEEAKASWKNSSKNIETTAYGQETVEVYACVPDCPIRIMDGQSGKLGLSGRKNPGICKNDMRGNPFGDNSRGLIPYFDSGGASRFFYCAKAKRSEKEAGLIEFVECVKCGKFNSKEHTIVVDGKKQKEKCCRNNHPTVKPLDLMKYLCNLIKMPNEDQVILDPFCGSGTTLVALEQLGINYIGIDQDSDSCLTAIGRIGV